MRAALLLPLATLALTACQQAPSQTAQAAAKPPVVTTSGPGGACNREAAQYTVGQVADERLLEDARKRSGAARARIVRPGAMITKELDTSRLTLDVDASDKVTRASCA